MLFHFKFLRCTKPITTHSFWKKKVLILKLHILLYLPVSSTIMHNSYFLKKNWRLNLFYSYYASSWSKRRACFTDVVFFSQFRRVVKAIINSQIFAKQVSRSSVNLFKYHLKKIVTKSKRQNSKPCENCKHNHPLDVLVIYTLQAFNIWISLSFSVAYQPMKN